MARLTREAIGKKLVECNVGNFSALLETSSEKKTSKNEVFNEDRKPDQIDSVRSTLLIDENKSKDNLLDAGYPKPLESPFELLDQEKIGSVKGVGLVSSNFEQEISASRQTPCFNEKSDPLGIDLEHSTLDSHSDHAKSLAPSTTLTPISTAVEINEFLELELTNILYGKGFNLITYLLDLCGKNCSLRTPAVASKELLELLQVTPTHLRNLILRISNKKVFKIISKKSGPHAFRVFEFDRVVYSSLISAKDRFFEKKAVKIESSEQVRDISFTQNNPNGLTDGFESIDCSPLESIGFNESHIVQVYREYRKKPEQRLSVDIIQDSIYALSFDLKHNNVDKDFKHPAAVVLLSLLKKGSPYSSKTPDLYLNPQEEAMKKYMDSKLSQLRGKQELENSLMQIALQEWQGNLGDEELNEFCSKLDNDMPGVPFKVQATLTRTKALKNAKEYFITNLWPSMKNKVVFDKGEIMLHV